MAKQRNLIDRLAGAVSPAWGVRRATARAQLNVVQRYTAGMLGGTAGNGEGYGRHGASTTKKSLIGWFTGRGAPEQELDENHDKLTERSRDLFMGSPLATGALKTIRTNVVGGGLRLKAALDFEFLGLSSEEAGKWEANTEREWRLFADSTMCDAYRRMTFGQIQSLAILTALHSGDAFAALPVKPRAGSPYDLRVMLIDPDRVCTPPAGIVGTRDVISGIEQSDDGEAVAAWVSKYHPDRRMVQNEWHRVRFYGEKSGAPQLLHLAQDWERIGQRRGVPLLAPVIEVLKQLTRYTEAELTACVVSSFFTVFVKSQTPQTPLAAQYSGDQQVDAADPGTLEMGSGTVVGLGDNEDITVANAGRANTSFDAFVQSIVRQMGAGIELPYEMVIKHFTASYSASRAALLEAWKMFRMRRIWLVDGFVQVVYEQWLAEAVAKGRIKAPGFFADPAVRAAWCGAEWFGPAQGHLNPLQEAKAAAVRIEEELSTREKEAAEASGMAWEDIHPVRAREENARRADKTIKSAGDWGTPGANTAAQTAATGDTQGDGEA